MSEQLDDEMAEGVAVTRGVQMHEKWRHSDKAFWLETREIER